MDLADCIKAQPGSFFTNEDSPPPPNPYHKTEPGEGIGKGEGDITDPPGGGETGPPIPSISYPNNILIVVPGGAGSTEQETETRLFDTFTLHQVPQYEGITQHVIVPDEGIGVGWEQSVTELPLNIVGTDLGNVPDGGITAKLTNLPSLTSPNSLPSISITFPTTEAASEYYGSMGPNGMLQTTFDIVYLVDLPNDQQSSFEVFRHNIEISIAIEFIIHPIPTVEYPQSAVIFYAQQEDNSTTIQPSQFDLVGATVSAWSIYFEGAPGEESDYDALATFDTVNGIIYLPMDLDNLSNPPTSMLLSLSLVGSDYFQVLERSIMIQSFGPEGEQDPPSYPTTDVTILYNDTTGGSTTITPINWPLNVGAYIGHLDALGSPTYGAGIDYGWDEYGMTGITSDNTTGVITLSNIPTEWTTQPTVIEMVAFSDSGSTGLIQFNIITKEYDPGGGTGGGGAGEGGTAGFTAGGGVYGAESGQRSTVGTGLPIVLPVGLPPAPRTPHRRKRVFVTKAVGNLGSYVNISVKDSPFDEQVKKLKSTEYIDGIRNPNLTFFNGTSMAPQIFAGKPDLFTFSVSGEPANRNVLSDSVDFSIDSIQRINQEPRYYDDFVYNVLTPTRIEKSLSNPVKIALSRKYNLDGSKLINSITKSVATALVANEELLSEKDIFKLVGGADHKKLSLSVNRSVNTAAAIDIFLNNSTSINPYIYNIADKNRMLNWKALAEDVNKRIIFKTADLVETPIYIPNSEVISVYDTTGGSHNLEMQDGDFFIAASLNGDDRLTVHSDQKDAVVLSMEDKARASRLCGGEAYMDLTCTSVESALIELNVDTTGARQDYYFLSLDKSTLEEVPSNEMFSRKTKVTYDYITDVSYINSFVQHKLPYNVITLRSDDIILNHLESSLKASVEFNDFSLNSFTNTPHDKLLVRDIPWYLIIIPSDLNTLAISQERSKMVTLNSRTLRCAGSLVGNSKGFSTPLINETVITTGGINFDVDRIDNTVYQESRQYSVNFDYLASYIRYKNTTESLPRKVHPTNKVLGKISTLKTEHSLTSRDSLTFYDIYSRLAPSEIRSLENDQMNFRSFIEQLKINKLSTNDQINTEYFVPIKDVSIVSQGPPEVLPSDTATVFRKPITGAEAAGPPTDAPDDRSGALG